MRKKKNIIVKLAYRILNDSLGSDIIKRVFTRILVAGNNGGIYLHFQTVFLTSVILVGQPFVSDNKARPFATKGY